jgi:16S rRNA (cytosine1402-N4)-methyltransferase
MNFEHVSVLLNECIEGLNIKSDGVYVDCTLGGGGHSSQIVKRLSDKGMLIGIDQDNNAIAAASERLKDYTNVKYVHDNFSNIENIIESLDLGQESVDGFLLDLGVSSHQLDEAERGFSYNHDAPLDMRMDIRSPLSAYKVVNEYSVDELNRIIREYCSGKRN